STTCVELGLRSEEGYFVKIVRSGRVEFPRNEPVGGGGTEWLSVRGASGPVGSRWAGAPGGAGGGEATGPGPIAWPPPGPPGAPAHRLPTGPLAPRTLSHSVPPPPTGSLRGNSTRPERTILTK